jgi:hypothetical protein
LRSPRLVITAAGLVLALAAAAGPALVQVATSDFSDGAAWEELLRSADIVDRKQLGGPDAVTRPWKLTLEKDGQRIFGLWKFIDSSDGGALDCWRFEIAAYRIDRLLGLNMVPPTVERPLDDRPGSLQLWVDGTASVKAIGPKISERSREQAGIWNRSAYIERAFDDLIANEDRNANNILATADWKMVLIDHSRAFRASRRFTRSLIFGPEGLMKSADGSPYLIKSLPRAVYEKIRSLDGARIRGTVATYLTEAEIEAVLARKALVLREIEALIAKNGEDQVLY